MDKTSRYDDLQEWLLNAPSPLDDIPEEKIDEVRNSVDNACYSFSEIGVWKADISVNARLAVQIWQVVELARTKGFPNDLRM